MLGRVTSATDPESGTAAYTYDSIASGDCAGNYRGDLIKRFDAVGNVTCYAYDSLHRLTDVTYPTGSYASVTAQKHFVYDAATVNSVVMSNAKARLAEAYTGTASSKSTDLGFSYSLRGEVADLYQSTPNSGGYYHAIASYWANGLVNVLKLQNTAQTPADFIPPITYAPEGEGRANMVSAATGQNPVTGTAYNDLTGQPTGVTFGSSDSDAFTYDSNTGRMTQYNFTVNGSSVIGNLTWNANGTVGALGITDPFNASNAQTCNYGYDDLARIQSANCGAVWSQTFGFDAFGNISKTGTIAFQPTYSTTTNRISTLPGFPTPPPPAYDANGNLTNDSVHTYTWDAEGKVLAVDTTSLTYDALGRMSLCIVIPDRRRSQVQSIRARARSLTTRGGSPIIERRGHICSAADSRRSASSCS